MHHKKRDFVHHYIREGQEEFEFVSALEDVNSLVNEYKSLENDYNNEGEEEEKEEESNK